MHEFEKLIIAAVKTPVGNFRFIKGLRGDDLGDLVRRCQRAGVDLPRSMSDHGNASFSWAGPNPARQAAYAEDCCSGPAFRS